MKQLVTRKPNTFKKELEYRVLISSPDKMNFYCAKFGCGKILTPQEYLSGKYCITHVNKQIVDITKIIKLKN